LLPYALKRILREGVIPGCHQTEGERRVSRTNRRTGVSPVFRVARSIYKRAAGQVGALVGRGTPCAPKRQARRLSYVGDGGTSDHRFVRNCARRLRPRSILIYSAYCFTLQRKVRLKSRIKLWQNQFLTARLRLKSFNVSFRTS
jgi:hypothetical protein